MLCLEERKVETRLDGGRGRRKLKFKSIYYIEKLVNKKRIAFHEEYRKRLKGPKHSSLTEEGDEKEEEKEKALENIRNWKGVIF